MPQLLQSPTWKWPHRCRLCLKSCNFLCGLSRKRCGITHSIVRLSCTEPGTSPRRRHEVSGHLGFPTVLQTRYCMLTACRDSQEWHITLSSLTVWNYANLGYFSEASFTILAKGNCRKLLGPHCLQLWACKHSHSVLQDLSVRGGSGILIHCLRHSEIGLRSGQWRWVSWRWETLAFLHLVTVKTKAIKKKLFTACLE